MTRRTVGVAVKKNDFDDKRINAGIRAASAYSKKVIGDKIRDRVKEEYVKSIHHTSYGNASPIDPMGTKSLTHAIVARHEGDRVFVGPKKGSLGKSTYEEIFGHMTHGTGKGGKGGKRWTFKLPPGREMASETGYWTTSGQKPKPFFHRAYIGYATQFPTDMRHTVLPILGKAMSRGGI